MDLVSGTWNQEHWNGGVLVWEDTWDTSSTLYNPFESNTHAVTLAASYALHVSTGASNATIAATTTLSVLALSLVAYACTKKFKAVSQKEDDINQPLL